MKMCQALVQEGHEVTLFAPSNEDTIRTETADLWSHYGVRVQFPIVWLRAKRILRGYDYIVRAVSIARTLKPSLVYTRLVPVGLLAAICGLNTVCEIHTPVNGIIGRRLFWLYLRLPVRRKIVVITESLKVWLNREMGGARRNLSVTVAPDGVDLERFATDLNPQEARQEIGIPDEFTAVYAGHLYPGRGIELIFDMARENPLMTFLIVGGESKAVESWKNLANQESLSNIKLMGFVPNERLPLYLAAADVFLMPHQKKVQASGGGDIAAYTSPLKMFEYLAAQRLLIASRLPVLQEVLNDKIAELCEPDNLDQWNEALRRARMHPMLSREKAKNAYKEVKQYTWRERVKRCVSEGN
jgi:glycosyltransferase involved in cell wall biosynthesis